MSEKIPLVERIENDFDYHFLNKSQIESCKAINRYCRELAISLELLCPESRELSLALTNLEQAMFWANASIARNKNEV